MTEESNPLAFQSTTRIRWYMREVFFPSTFEGGPGTMEKRWFLQQWLVGGVFGDGKWRDVEGTLGRGFKL